jgi:hypothetical protein
MRVPHVNVLKALGNAGEPLTLSQLTTEAGYNEGNGTASRALYGVPEDSSSGPEQTGLLALGYVHDEPIQGAGGGRALNHFSITACGMEALEEELAATGGELPPPDDDAGTAGILASNVRFEIESGWPSGLDTFQRRISAYTRSDRVRGWKVGISAYPRIRAGQHDRSGTGYDEMVVIYMTRSIKNARHVEHWITMQYVGHHDNDRHGGGGLEAEADAHYVYLLLRR